MKGYTVMKDIMECSTDELAEIICTLNAREQSSTYLFIRTMILKDHGYMTESECGEILEILKELIKIDSKEYEALNAKYDMSAKHIVYAIDEEIADIVNDICNQLKQRA